MLLRFSPPACSNLSPNGCAVPNIHEVVRFANRFGVRVVSIRPSSYSLSHWVAVCSFAAKEAAQSFSAAAGVQFFGCHHVYFAMRQVGHRWRVSVPCINPPLFAVGWRWVIHSKGCHRYLVGLTK